MNDVLDTGDNHIDDHVDEEIKTCFDIDAPKSFFTFAGAGSGKTRSLVNTLKYIDDKYREYFINHSRRVAVMTYTNAASDEISRRVEYNPIFSISTIHSFLWGLIKNHQSDIQDWVINDTKEAIADLEEKERRGRAGAASENRKKQILSKQSRLEKMKKPIRFTYNPNGENIGFDSLNHTEVIKIGTHFIQNNKNMQKILINKFPIMLIDESQDTKKELIDALLFVAESNESFVVGMFGDMMQRIYSDGKEDLAQIIPEDWIKPEKVMNHRSRKRIVDLANAIRKDVDGMSQKYRSDKLGGFVHLFITDNTADKQKFELNVSQTMAKITGDKKWLIPSETKSLILEHHMAASRFGFLEFFTPLYKEEKLKIGSLDGSLPEVTFFTNIILPLREAYLSGDNFEISRIVKKYSPLLSKKAFLKNKSNQLDRIRMVNESVNRIFELWCSDKEPTCLEILACIDNEKLFEIPERLQGLHLIEVDDVESTEDSVLVALHSSMSVPFSQIKLYDSYVSGESPFDTHQGVKGLEFPRVAVILDDEEAKGFLFSYEKVFEAVEMTATDKRNEIDGKDNSISRTKRLFYVTCTRAEDSLALIAYTKDPQAVKQYAMSNSWLSEDEITVFD